MTNDDIIEQAARAIAEHEACGHCEGTCSSCRGLAKALADKGLLATHPVTRHQVVDAVTGITVGKGRYYSLIIAEDAAEDVADAVFDHLHQAPKRDVEAEARAEAKRRCPISPSMPSMERFASLAQRHGFVDGALWATGGTR